MYGSAYECVSQYEYHSSTLPHLLSLMYDLLINSFSSSLDITDVHAMK